MTIASAVGKIPDSRFLLFVSFSLIQVGIFLTLKVNIVKYCTYSQLLGASDRPNFFSWWLNFWLLN